MFRCQMPRACSSLLKKKWQPYETSKVPKTGGIYGIGNANGKFHYVGQSSNLRERLNRLKYGKKQNISKLVKKGFATNSGKNLKIKWITTKDHKCLEGWVLDCLAKTIGYWPSQNKKRGNKC